MASIEQLSPSVIVSVPETIPEEAVATGVINESRVSKEVLRILMQVEDKSQKDLRNLSIQIKPRLLSGIAASSSILSRSTSAAYFLLTTANSISFALSYCSYFRSAVDASCSIQRFVRGWTFSKYFLPLIILKGVSEVTKDSSKLALNVFTIKKIKLSKEPFLQEVASIFFNVVKDYLGLIPIASFGRLSGLVQTASLYAISVMKDAGELTAKRSFIYKLRLGALKEIRGSNSSKKHQQVTDKAKEILDKAYVNQKEQDWSRIMHDNIPFWLKLVVA